MSFEIVGEGMSQILQLAVYPQKNAGMFKHDLPQMMLRETIVKKNTGIL